MKVTHIGIFGANGKMGKELIRLLLSNKNTLILKKAFVAPQSTLKNQKLTESILYERLSFEALKKIDVLIDFTESSATMQALVFLKELKIPSVIGTTGFSDVQKDEIKKLSRIAPVVFAPNTSIGINTLIQLIQRALKLLPQEFDPAIIEIHHKDKKDAPSGTALQLKNVIQHIRPDSSIAVQSLRGGDVIGEHSVLLVGEGERLELIHRATSRNIFAKGALKAAEWVVHQKPGLYTMQDVLEGKTT